MRSYILSEHEREMLIKFVGSGEKTYGFDVLRKRIRDYLPQIENDLLLINEVKLKINGAGNSVADNMTRNEES